MSASGAEETMAASRSLGEMASGLSQIVGQFKV